MAKVRIDPIAHDGRSFVGVVVRPATTHREVVTYAPERFPSHIPFVLQSYGSQKLLGRVSYFMPGVANGARADINYEAMLFFYTSGSALCPGMMVVRFQTAGHDVEAIKAWSDLVRTDVVESRECQPPDVYVRGAARRDDALVLRLTFKDGSILPLSYATPLAGSEIGSRADLEAKAGDINQMIAAIRRQSEAETEEKQKQTDVGFRGARLGTPFVYGWTDQQPTLETWEDRADRSRAIWGGLFVLLLALAGIILGGGFGLLVALVYLTPIALIGGYFVNWYRRSDQEPVPRAVWNEAYIELVGEQFFFVLEANGKPVRSEPWSRVVQFEVSPYWEMFGDAGASPHKTGWHAIVMDPGDAAPWCIASTIEGMAAVRERRAALDAKFGVATRTKFLQRLKVERERDAMKQDRTPVAPISPESDEKSQSPPNESVEVSVDGVPLRL